MEKSSVLTEEIKRTFANKFLKWGLLLNYAAVDYAKTHLVKKDSWEIRFIECDDSKGKYLEFYAIHDSFKDTHFRIFDNGEEEELEAIAESYDYDETVPGDKEKKHNEYTNRNRELYKQLKDLGLYK